MSLYNTIKNRPWIWWVASKARYLPGFHWLWKRWFRTSTSHWQRHYQRGGNSGPGSYGESALYKAALINQTIRERGIRSIIELGCGDGNQLSLLEINRYMGMDVSKVAIEKCLARHGNTPGRSFIWYDPDYFHDPLRVVNADCAISLDVIFHLVEDTVFKRYIHNLFNCGERFVLIYALDVEQTRSVHVSVRLRKYSDYIAAHVPEFHVAQHVSATGTFGDFYVYQRNDRKSS